VTRLILALKDNPRIIGWAFLVVAVSFSLIEQTIYVERVSRDEARIAAVVSYDHAAIQRHALLLKRVEADEQRLCVAAKSTGDQTIIKILCSASGGPP